MAKYPHVADLFHRQLGDYPDRGALARLAAACDVSPTTVTRWAKGESRPTAPHWPKLAEALGTDVPTLRAAYEGNDAMVPSGRAPDSIDAKLDRLLNAITSPEAERRTRAIEDLLALAASASSLNSDVLESLQRLGDDVLTELREIRSAIGLPARAAAPAAAPRRRQQGRGAPRADPVTLAP
jgi:transcriptional regulator with XRE-family HTH domain